MSLLIQAPAMRAACVLALGESDASGVGGIQAAIRACVAAAVYPSTVVTRLAAPGAGSWSVPLPVATAQLTAVLERVDADAVLVGVIADEKMFGPLADILEPLELPTVLNPSLFTAEGQPFSPEALVPLLRERLLRQASVATLNMFEAEAISGQRTTSLEGRRDALKALFDLGVAYPMIKSAPDTRHAIDLVYNGADFFEFGADRQKMPAQGAGVTLAALITAQLSRGQDPLDAIDRAKSWLGEAIKAGVPAHKLPGPVQPATSLYEKSQLRYDCILAEELNLP